MEKVYFITGASSEVGISFIETLDQTVNETVTVVAHYGSNKDNLESLKTKLKKVQLFTIQADLSQSDGAQKILSFIEEQKLTVSHVLHLAAAKLSYGKIKKWDEEKAKKEMQIQYFSFAAIMKELLAEMAKNHYGRVCVMLSSVVLGTPPKFMSDYVVTKSALLGYMKAMASEYADSGVRINGISPNMMETKFLSEVNEKIVELAAENSSLKRHVTVEETVKGIMFLLSDDATCMNGANLNFSGGDYMN